MAGEFSAVRQGKGIRDALPLYYRIFLVLEQKIRAGHWREGVVLPSEQDLAAEFEVSRVTIRNTMALLEEANLITRHRGRGTFVNPTILPPEVSDGMAGFKMNIREFEETTEVELHEFAEVDVPPDIMGAVDTPSGQRGLRIRRTRRQPGGRAFSYSVVHVLPPEAYLLSQETLGNRTVIAALEEKGFVFAKAEQRLTAVAADAELAQYLDVVQGAPLICLKRAVFDDQERIVEFIEIYYNPEFFEYRVGLSREKGDSSPQWVPRL
ncbi:MAG: GntR family transcriptional regulator [Pararhodobacter sp.]|nr:GntR family transcriptional regulator [Pararhodobacter sp.]